MAPSKTKPITPRRQSKLNFGSKSATAKTSVAKKPANGNILNFFQKVEVEEQLFCGDIKSTSASNSTTATATANANANATFTLSASNSEPTSKPQKEDEDLFGDEHIIEHPRSSKRRKLSHDGIESLPLKSKDQDRSEQSNLTTERTLPKRARKGKIPFLNDSDSEDDDIQISPSKDTVKTEATIAPQTDNTTQESKLAFVPHLPVDESCPDISHIPPLKEEDYADKDFKDLEDIEELFDGADEFDDGEEYRERKYMEEQARLEAEETENHTSNESTKESQDVEGIVECCPLCNASLAGVSADQAAVHVNACLDGNTIPSSKPDKPPSPKTVDAPEISKRFARAAIPRPGQSNPISVGSTTSQSTSAFSKLMSRHAEDAAWASAAASENASRGKPAYQRTCPFYKIMPGFSICVDAFRYGAVQGCNAYFLSHFHSDHYIGLTANWTHGPIYCSKVTGSLVKSQLKTAAKWVKELEFEETVEIPGTEGATVTMIPANHCPGSSLFLFEKTIGKGPRKQRILHCGDFRACPAHVTHSLLKPETIDALSGKVKQQKIDVCYLDTTYLNPRYSFPPQDDVITACAQFCKSIAGDVDAEEFLSAAKQEKSSMSKFLRKEGENPSTSTTKAESDSKSKKKKAKDRLLVICGTYSIGKERICKAIAQALGTKIFASAAKIRMCSQLGDPELAALMTSNPLEAQVHMQMLMEIRAETLQDYLDGYKPHFSRIVGFRPSGWNYRSPTSNAKNVTANVPPSTVPTTTLLHGPAWRTRFSTDDLAAQRGSTREAMCFGVPYSEHSSFRELALFLMALRVEKVVPTVNVGSEQGRRRMKAWTDRWLAERRKGGIVKVLEEVEGEEGVNKDKDKNEAVLWDGKDGKGGGVYW